MWNNISILCLAISCLINTYLIFKLGRDRKDVWRTLNATVKSMGYIMNIILKEQKDGTKR